MERKVTEAHQQKISKLKQTAKTIKPFKKGHSLEGMGQHGLFGRKKFRAFILQLSVWWQRVGAALEKVR